MEQLKRIEVAHGTFFFGPHSHQEEVDSTYDPSIQQNYLDNESIHVEEEEERCAWYNYQMLNEDNNPKRRRLFLGAMVGDDCLEVLRAVATEAYFVHSFSLYWAKNGRRTGERSLSSVDENRYENGVHGITTIRDRWIAHGLSFPQLF